jgi:hypothetical protein
LTPLRLFDPGPPPLCAHCTWAQACGAADTPIACNPYPDRAGGGTHALHPLRSHTAILLNSVGGPEFTPIHAEPVVLPRLPAYLPQIRLRTSLRGYLDERVYAVRAHEVIGQRRSVLAARSLRRAVGLAPEQKLVLLLFDDDAVLERLWTEGVRLFPQIAAAGYDLVVCPSYSAWLPRPRPDFLFSAKRSLVAFAALQRLGVPALPRLAWVFDHDVRRAAAWACGNSAVEVIALDLQTYARNQAALAEQLEGLRLFDRLTGRHLHYLINGPTAKRSVEAVYTVVPERRVCITSATASAPFAMSNTLTQEQLPIKGRDRVGLTFAPRCAERRTILRQAAESARQGRRRPMSSGRA